MTDLKTAATRAADWLEANRDKHIVQRLAVDDNGKSVKFTDPNATCFCALGRLGKELDLEQDQATDYEPLMNALIPAGVVIGEIYSENDRGSRMVRDDQVVLAPTTCGIVALRELAK